MIIYWSLNVGLSDDSAAVCCSSHSTNCRLFIWIMVRQFLEGGFSDASEDKKIPKKQDRGRAGILDSAFSRASAPIVVRELSRLLVILLRNKKRRNLESEKQREVQPTHGVVSRVVYVDAVQQ